jgi:glycosyltransferase involved in cell wall biosynthesis
MNIHLENVALQSTSGPNHFASKLVSKLEKLNVTVDNNLKPDARLCFIETYNNFSDNVPLFQRLDGIYFNTAQNYNQQNANIKKTYDMSNGVIFQSYFNKELITKYFGEHKNSTIIHNGADLEYISKYPALENRSIDKFENVWCCASSWRPHKRLNENIRYFLEHAGEKDCLVIAGSTQEKFFKNEKIFYVGAATVPQLISLYKRSKYFLHLAWLDHCPNVVVDAKASGCQIICSSTGGTKEVAGVDAIVVEEELWNFDPVELYSPPKIDFSKKRLKNTPPAEYNIDMHEVAKKYLNFIEGGDRIEVATHL